MKVTVQPISINPSKTESRLVKQGAFAVFRALRVIADQAKKTPGILAQASVDVREAWEESSRPNV